MIDKTYYLRTPAPISQCSCGEKSPATHHCHDCGEDLCPTCVGAHQRVRVTREHKVVPIEGKVPPEPLNPRDNPKVPTVEDLEKAVLGATAAAGPSTQLVGFFGLGSMLTLKSDSFLFLNRFLSII